MYFKNFTFKEIFAHCTKNEIIDALGNKEIMSNILDLLHLLQNIRDCEQDSTPIFINSGYRDSAHNKRVGGVPTSQHLLGQAADLRNEIGCADITSGIKEFLRNDANKGLIGQVIVYIPLKDKDKFDRLKKENSILPEWRVASCFYDSFIHIALPNVKYKSFTPSIKFF